ncbi:VOC family protein [Virgisporangium aurantiacum]|uniref:VOC domain-containing protein n=1 Tax=Virgisporangium aurantiacum TaxID=175570 RepID=A0A8J4E088_9ACTN|nr:VOC family protein [Virgisporangium aurantiacum]GIJ54777.1 hypothetical protein Vau01_022930 [Virgisporangium aurantiacum]
MPATIRLYAVTVDCPDPAALAEFYSQLLSLKISYSTDDFAGLDTEGGPAIGFQRVAGFNRPQWPDQSVPQQFHLDLSVDDLAEAEAEALRLGATVAGHQPNPDSARVLLDPAGHPFCLGAMG